MLLASILSLLLACVTGMFGAVYCFKPDMIVRQANGVAQRRPRLLQFALPIRPRGGRITARQVRSTGLGMLLLSAWFLVLAFMGIFSHH
jgi:uncharacterized membrane protein YadS